MHSNFLKSLESCIAVVLKDNTANVLLEQFLR